MIRSLYQNFQYFKLNFTWVGCLYDDLIDKKDKPLIEDYLYSKFNCVPIFISRNELDFMQYGFTS
jgi:hypothetical protein